MEQQELNAAIREAEVMIEWYEKNEQNNINRANGQKLILKCLRVLQKENNQLQEKVNSFISEHPLVKKEIKEFPKNPAELISNLSILNEKLKGDNEKLWEQNAELKARKWCDCDNSKGDVCAQCDPKNTKISYPQFTDEELDIIYKTIPNASIIKKIIDYKDMVRGVATKEWVDQKEKDSQAAFDAITSEQLGTIGKITTDMATTPPLISMDKKYETTDGKPVRLFAVDSKTGKPVVGEVEHNGEFWIWSWDRIGRCLDVPSKSLVEVVEKKKVKVEVEIMGSGYVVIKQCVPTDGGTDVIVARKTIEIDFFEGEGQQ